jgi:hypothetical protein
MVGVVVFVNHTKKIILVVELENLWEHVKSIFELWKDDMVEILQEHDDFQKLRYLANNENYSHTLGNIFW